MSEKRQVNVRLSEPGWQRLIDLVRLYGSKTMAIEMALERLWMIELRAWEDPRFPPAMAHPAAVEPKDG